MCVIELALFAFRETTMHHALAAIRAIMLVGVGFFTSGAAAMAQAPVEKPLPKVRKDPFGKPLPPYAIARIGSASLALGSQESAVMQLAVSGDGKLLASGTSNGQVRVWDAVSGKLLHLLRKEVDHRAWALAWSPDSKLLAVADGGYQPWIDLYSIRTGTKRQFSIGKPYYPHLLQFSPDGKILAVVADSIHVHLPERITLWDVASGKLVRILGDDEAGILSLVFSADGATLTTLASAGQLRRWNVRTGKATGQLPIIDGKVYRAVLSRWAVRGLRHPKKVSLLLSRSGYWQRTGNSRRTGQSHHHDH